MWTVRVPASHQAMLDRGSPISVWEQEIKKGPLPREGVVPIQRRQVWGTLSSSRSPLQTGSARGVPPAACYDPCTLGWSLLESRQRELHSSALTVSGPASRRCLPFQVSRCPPLRSAPAHPTIPVGLSAPVSSTTLRVHTHIPSAGTGPAACTPAISSDAHSSPPG